MAEQTLGFLHACLTGALLGLLYDAFRISRIAIPTHRAVVFAEDILFFLLCAVTTFVFLLRFADGKIRVFLIIGELLGAVLYFCTVGQLIMKVSRLIIEALKTVARFIFKWILLPIWKLFYAIVSFLLIPFRFLFKILKKYVQKLKFRLKIGRTILYNHSIKHLRTKRTAKKPEELNVDGTQSGRT